MSRQRTLISLAGILAIKSAAQAASPERPALPDTAEIATFVRDHWADWKGRFAHFASRNGKDAILVRVESAKCTYFSEYLPDCEITITGRFEDGAEMTRTLSAMFDRTTEGRLVEVVAIIGETRGPTTVEPVDTPPVE